MLPRERERERKKERNATLLVSRKREKNLRRTLIIW